MYPRTNYEMTQDQLDKILEACKPVQAIMIGHYAPSSPQENANNVWACLGKEMGFDHMTVQPIIGKGARFFSAVPSETDEVRGEREEREAAAARSYKITQIKNDIVNLQKMLSDLETK